MRPELLRAPPAWQYGGEGSSGEWEDGGVGIRGKHLVTREPRPGLGV